MLIIVQGLIGSGKDEVARYLHNHYQFKTMSFADTLKKSISAIFGWKLQLLQGKTVKSRIWREQVDEWWSERLGIPHLTPRWVLQHWGTDVIRNGFHNDIWLASVENMLRTIDTSKKNIVINDCRFANETAAMKKQGAILIRVNRGEKPVWYETAREELFFVNLLGRDAVYESSMQKNYPDIHISEWGWLLEKPDFEIDNNGTVDDLHRLIDDILSK